MISNTVRTPVTLLLFLLFSFGTGTAQSTFQKYFQISTDSLSEGFCVAGFQDSTIAVGGQMAQNLVSGNVDAVVFRLDGQGNKLWTLRLGDPATDESISDMEALIDGDLLVSYISYSDNALIFSTIVRISSAGSVVWSKRITDNTDIFGVHITTVAGGFILDGFSNSGNSTALFKIDAQGNSLWSKTYFGIALGNNGVAQDKNGNIHLAGRSNGQGAWAVVKNADGSFVNSLTYNSANILSFEIVNAVQSDSMLLVGTDFTNNFVLLKTDLNGMPGSFARYGYGTSTLFPIGVHSSGNGDFAMSVYQQGGADQAGMMANFSTQLSPRWAKTYTSNNGNVGYFLDMDVTPKGYVLSGTYRLFGKERSLLVQTDYNGDIKGKCCPRTITLNKTITTIQTGESGLDEGQVPQLENLTVTGQLINADPMDVCPTPERINVADTLLCPGLCTTILLGGSIPGTNYNWSLSGGEPDTSMAVNPGKVCYNNIGVFPIRVYSESCLLDSTAIPIRNEPDFFPNAFSPNGDNANDFFKPTITCPFDDYRLQIFNRWGDLIFETFDLKPGWDGSANGQAAPVDVYIYRVEFYAVRNGVRTLVFNDMKEVTLIR